MSTSSLNSDTSRESSCKYSETEEKSLKIADTNASSWGEDKSSSEAVTKLTDVSLSGSHNGKRILSEGIQTIVIMNKNTHAKHVEKPKQKINILYDFPHYLKWIVIRVYYRFLMVFYRQDKRKRLFQNNEIVSSCLKPINYK